MISRTYAAPLTVLLAALSAISTTAQPIGSDITTAQSIETSITRRQGYTNWCNKIPDKTIGGPGWRDMWKAADALLAWTDGRGGNHILIDYHTYMVELHSGEHTKDLNNRYYIQVNEATAPNYYLHGFSIWNLRKSLQIVDACVLRSNPLPSRPSCHQGSALHSPASSKYDQAIELIQHGLVQ